MMRTISLLQAIDDRNLFAPWFKDRTTWASWFVFLRALFGLPLASHELPLFRQCTGRAAPPTAVAKEAWLVCGRRSGKSFMLALVAVFLGCFFNYRRYLQAGERGTIMVIACDRRQARTTFRYIQALLRAVPMLNKLVVRETAEAFDLNNGVTIEVAVASFRSVRGYTILAALCDELAFWHTDDSANPDSEIIAAIRPAMATIPNAMLLCASSPYAQRGALFDAFKRHFGQDDVNRKYPESEQKVLTGDVRNNNAKSAQKVRTDSVLVWRAPTRTMNPTVPQREIDEAIERDPARYTAEYLAEFRADVEAFVVREVVEACVVAGRFELPRVDAIRYYGFTDPSGGSSDSMTLAVAHLQGDRVVLDALRERRPPFSPDDVVAEFAAALKSYGISTVTGDRYAAEWPRERFRIHGVEFRVGDKPKSDLYRDLLPVLNSGRIELLDHHRLVGQLCSLERRTARGGKDSIDHPPGSFDDVANAVAGVSNAALMALRVPELPVVAPWCVTRQGVLSADDAPYEPGFSNWHSPADWGPVGSGPPP
jgi:hypothetical protein